jgi:hypothetical protein
MVDSSNNPITVSPNNYDIYVSVTMSIIANYVDENHSSINVTFTGIDNPTRTIEPSLVGYSYKSLFDGYINYIIYKSDTVNGSLNFRAGSGGVITSSTLDHTITKSNNINSFVYKQIPYLYVKVQTPFTSDSSYSKYVGNELNETGVYGDIKGTTEMKTSFELLNNVDNNYGGISKHGIVESLLSETTETIKTIQDITNTKIFQSAYCQ